MSTRGVAQIITLLALAVPSCQPSSSAVRQNGSAATTSSDSSQAPVAPQGSFAYVDTTGTQLLALGATEDPSKIRGAICSTGQTLKVRFDHRQNRQQEDNGRQTVSNFSRQGGDIFRLVGGTTRPDETCFLSGDSAVLARAVPVASQGLSGCSPTDSSRVAGAKRRQVVHCWHVARTATGVDLLAAQFATIDSSALASLVVVHDSSLLFNDFPAVYRGPDESVWRVDDGGVFSPGDFQILFIAELPRSYVMAITWAGAEGESDQLLVADSADAFRTVVRGYRYWVPE